MSVTPESRALDSDPRSVHDLQTVLKECLHLKSCVAARSDGSKSGWFLSLTFGQRIWVESKG